MNPRNLTFDNLYYLDDRHQVIKAESFEEWAAHFSFGHPVASDQVGQAEVNTVFLGHGSFERTAQPVLFETMIFGGPKDTCCWRWSTWDEAMAGHQRIVESLRDL